MALQSDMKISAVLEVLMVVIKDRSSIFLPKAVNFFWTEHCHTPVDNSLHNDVHFQDTYLNPLNAKLNPICHLLALLGGATVVVVSRLRFNFVYYVVTCEVCTAT